jgi:hypothetical protein
MQLERVITMTFYGYGGGQEELESNQQSYHDRYLNVARHPRLTQFDEYKFHNNGSSEAKVDKTTHRISGKNPDEVNDRIGVYLIAHGNGGDSEPGAPTLAKLMIAALAKDNMRFGRGVYDRGFGRGRYLR